MMSGAPVSLLHQAARTAAQESMLIHSGQVDDAIRQLLRHADHVGVDPRWLALARDHLQIGLMCVNRAIMRQDVV
jgi:hypothetical protein